MIRFFPSMPKRVPPGSRFRVYSRRRLIGELEYMGTYYSYVRGGNRYEAWCNTEPYAAWDVVWLNGERWRCHNQRRARCVLLGEWKKHLPKEHVTQWQPVHRPPPSPSGRMASAATAARKLTRKAKSRTSTGSTALSAVVTVATCVCRWVAAALAPPAKTATARKTIDPL